MPLHTQLRKSDASIAGKLADEAGLHSLIARILAGRGITDAEAARAFLSPSEEGLHDPFLLPGMRAAVERLEEAFRKRERIMVHGDYDTDGLTATALLVQSFNALGATTDYFIPNRLDEGYGLRMEGVDHARKTGASLIVTCDCGVTSREEVEYAARLGVDVIITDHHEPEPPLPQAVAVVNPKAPESEYPFMGLAGVGVAGKLVMALMEHLGMEPPLTNLLRICALGTIADMVPLVDENRYIAHHGLAYLAGTPNVGLRELIRISGLNLARMSADDVSYRLAPRINAAGRFGKHQLALDLLFTRSVSEARSLALKLNDLNARRQRMVDASVAEAIEMVENRPQFDAEKIIVIGRPNWHRGLVGLVASRLVELYSRPALAFAIEGDTACGSGRSIPAFNMVKNLATVSGLFTRFGGHAMAIGFELPAARIEELRAALVELAAKAIPDEALERAIIVDGEVRLDDLTHEFAEQYKQLEPFGYGNETPLMLARGVRLTATPRLLKDKHLKLSLKDEDGARTLTALAWNMADRTAELSLGGPLDILFSISFNHWRGKEELQLTVKDFAQSASV